MGLDFVTAAECSFLVFCCCSSRFPLRSLSFSSLSLFFFALSVLLEQALEELRVCHRECSKQSQRCKTLEADLAAAVTALDRLKMSKERERAHDHDLDSFARRRQWCSSWKSWRSTSTIGIVSTCQFCSLFRVFLFYTFALCCPFIVILSFSFFLLFCRWFWVGIVTSCTASRCEWERRSSFATTAEATTTTICDAYRPFFSFSFLLLFRVFVLLLFRRHIIFHFFVLVFCFFRHFESASRCCCRLADDAITNSATATGILRTQVASGARHSSSHRRATAQVSDRSSPCLSLSPFTDSLWFLSLLPRFSLPSHSCSFPFLCVDMPAVSARRRRGSSSSRLRATAQVPSFLSSPFLSFPSHPSPSLH